ncbi:para-aminobenzoate synthase, (PABA) [Xylographa vitiligo]|nr:para-aminobenzoate synthase, (PABA) [Xylographa vitiligo]
MSLKPRVLFLDAYDSFSNNIIALLEAHCNVHVTKVYIDAVIPDLDGFLTAFAAIVCGPGPGHPKCPKDVGLFKDVWALPDDSIIPVLGICLGFQSLAHDLGASVVCLPQPRHGIRTCVTTSSTSIFEDIPEVHTVQYHSLHAVLGEDTSTPLMDTRLWKPSVLCPDLQPLAWDFSGQAGMDSKFQKNPHSILMAIKHKGKPYYGIQFHPESICSDPSAQLVVANWWRCALEWLGCNRPVRLLRDDTIVPDRFRPLLYESNMESGDNSQMTRSASSASTWSSTSSAMTSDSIRETYKDYPKLVSATLPIGALTVPSICDALDLAKDECVILDSEMRQLPQLGVSSIIGIVLPRTKKITYSVGAKQAKLHQEGREELIDLDDYEGSIFSFIRAFMYKYKTDTNADRAFCGGLMGYITYEAGLETIGVSASACSSGPDICFAFIEHSILIDHKQRTIHIQFLQMGEHDYEADSRVTKTANILENLSQENAKLAIDIQSHTFPKAMRQRTPPTESEYKAKIARCQREIGAGNSYELCLTDQTSVSLGDDVSSWDMFVKLRQLNPAPFAAYVRLGPLTLLSTSPERFMNWSRFQTSHNGSENTETELFSRCQFRPIKGTVKKDQLRSDGTIHRVTRLEATEILKTQKEQAENLMIVDLIRHDLYGVCRDVCVEGLMVVEEYESVFQLVSVIEGKLYNSRHSMPPTADETSGIDCLAASLPPGSMTGAPKRRSCQLLREIENEKPRSVYSGVLGYMCVSGKGDFSVVIRSLYKWDSPEADHSTWKIGAGGAITTLSTEEDEWEEMLTKLQSTYRLFGSR